MKECFRIVDIVNFKFFYMFLGRGRVIFVFFCRDSLILVNKFWAVVICSLRIYCVLGIGEV